MLENKQFFSHNEDRLMTVIFYGLKTKHYDTTRKSRQRI